MKKLIYLLSISCCLCLEAQTTIENVNKLFKNNPKPILIEFTTDWCGYCLIQDKQLERNSKLNEWINQHYYYLKIDGESLDKIEFLGNNYPSNSTNKQKNTHSLVYALLPEKETLSYPYWVILNKNQMIDFNYSGYIKPKNLQQLLNQYIN